MRDVVEWVHHNLKTPLAALLGHADLVDLDGAELPEHVRSSIEGMRRAGARLDEVVFAVCDLIDIACADTRHLQLVDLSELVAEELSACMDAAVRAGVRLSFRGVEGALCTGDPSALGRAVRALLEHAVGEAAPGTEVEVRTTPTDRGVRVTVVRRSPGVPPFAQERAAGADGLEDSCSRHLSGTGFGVVLASTVASVHGGRVRVGGPEDEAVLQMDLPADDDRTPTGA
ncbi:HAMP domain-containing histidine kinase [Nocardioides KLBMP 9356]|uniref:histidine kinase n=1 Tax=Nocardioides potassii TaxID=2911371 RepID=A0ABS9H898_9ACTN|nr:HAMP domain-containing sensor histidine kinase [Nocardioides potassii]MCF6376679.1 HAMP domain-containing histidine kinase [Nocardioides potassii]